MILIADSSALIALSVAESLHFLDQLFGAVWVPQAVFDECTFEGKPQSLELRHYLALFFSLELYKQALMLADE